MEKSVIVRRGLIILSVGILIGLIISASLNWTNSGKADTQPTAIAKAESSEKLDNSPGVQALEELSNAFANVAEKVNPSVVMIFTETQMRVANDPFRDFFGDDFYKRFFGAPRGDGGQKYTQKGLGSGVIVASDGIIVTNNHVVKDADDIKVRLMNGKEYKAEIKGRDGRTDLAVIKIDAKNLKAIRFGDSDKARVGEWVLAIGSPLSPELEHTVTSGIISAKGRSGIGLGNVYQDYIQTDAAINPGNSGGALTNLKGQLIGINAAIATRTGGFMGIGFAIPSNLVKKVMSDILTKGKVSRGWLGVHIQDLNEETAKYMKLDNTDGVLINDVVKDGPAEKAGVKVQDVVVKVNDRKVKNTVELATQIGSAAPGTKVNLTVIRDGKQKTLGVKLGEFPETEEQPVASNNITNDLGMRVSDITPDLVQQFNLKISGHGVVISGIERGSAAVQAGLKVGDVILKINRKPIENLSDFNRIMKNVKKGDSLLLYVQREVNKFFVAFTVPE